MDVIRKTVKWQRALVYLHDINIFSILSWNTSRTYTKYYISNQTLESRSNLRNAHFLRTLSTTYGTSSLSDLGINTNIRPSAVSDLEGPQIVAKLYSFLRPVIAIRRLIPNIAHIADIMSKRIRKNNAQTFHYLTKSGKKAMKLLHSGWYRQKSYCCLAPKADTMLILILVKRMSVPFYFKNSRRDGLKESGIG